MPCTPFAGPARDNGTDLVVDGMHQVDSIGVPGIGDAAVGDP